MEHATSSSGEIRQGLGPRLARSPLPPLAALAAAFGLAVAGSAFEPRREAEAHAAPPMLAAAPLEAAGPPADPAQAAVEMAEAGEPAPEGPSVDLATAEPVDVEPLDGQALLLWREALLGSRGAASPDVLAFAYDPLQDLAAPDPGPAGDASRLAQTVPLPMPRPPEFRRLPGAETARRAERLAARRAASAAPAAPVADERSFIEKLFNIERAPASTLAYASLSPNPAESLQRRAPVAPVPSFSGGSGVAVYDISARLVTLPNGQKLEAHSGLGASMDDPASVNIKMRGATPPGTYDLTEREQLFHGVRAIRLNPVGGSAAVYGRAGLLAHTYMLGPSGASNGCVSFKDYDKFLQAYLRGEIQRLVVVAGSGQDRLPSLAGRGRPARLARVGDDS
ncbi:DUF2778 domain-containing protein [Methylobacterium oxalidis]|uniref:DUF2778 domain-containing protein n=1 Tax=Methylobacterium oxalidis TaxID=944322 RepID=UPI0033155E42